VSQLIRATPLDGTRGPVDVVIPTLGRSTLTRALRSVRDQTLQPQTVYIVNDSSEAVTSQLSAGLRENEVLLATGGGHGGGYARELGRRACRSEFVAYLDDDDWWDPAKLQLQLELARASHADVVFTAATFHRADGREQVLPRRLPPTGAALGDYILERPSIRFGDGYIQSSTMLVKQTESRSLTWRSLSKHQDWDFVVRAALDGAQFAYCPLPLVHVHQGTLGSISRAADWHASLQWIAGFDHVLSSRAIGDFVASEVLRSALAARDRAGVMAALRILVAQRPHAAALLVGLSGLIRTGRG
jgi:glycosyltransferase involved in cell wall biosynthesis